MRLEHSFSDREVFWNHLNAVITEHQHLVLYLIQFKSFLWLAACFQLWLKEGGGGWILSLLVLRILYCWEGNLFLLCSGSDGEFHGQLFFFFPWSSETQFPVMIDDTHTMWSEKRKRKDTLKSSHCRSVWKKKRENWSFWTSL